MDMWNGDLGETYVKRIHVGNVDLGSQVPSKVILQVKQPKQCTHVGLGQIMPSHQWCKVQEVSGALEPQHG